MNQEIINFLKAALECSIFLDPTSPGLSYDEILEVGRRVGWQAGEISDALPYATKQFIGAKRLLPDDNTVASWTFLFPEVPEYRDFSAFDFVVSELNSRGQADGAANAHLERSVVVERAVAQGIPRNNIELAITYQLMAKLLTEENGVLRFTHRNGVRMLPSEQLQRSGLTRPIRNEARVRAYPLVKDVIHRRTDGRPKHVESLDAFPDELDKLGYGAFRLWWIQTVAELRHGDAHSSPVAVSVLAAALVEGALTFVVKHARSLKLAVFRSSDFDREPRTWKIEDLVASAASGSNDAILDLQTKARTELLIRARQRIHAGRLLSDFPTGVPDIRPEEARDAKATTEQVVRRVLDWLQKFPPA
jgi:hypothetical protein